MIGASTLVMHGPIHLDTYAQDHVLFLQTRARMSLHMGGVLTIIQARRDRGD
ncbi:hypothetical protein MWU52_11575 [Jannaschia sp. S6380]|uniref:hypothetical protein n=1 Tax=Jannaschia sp. S6380 TaxID=2926408 RepID=UPI001FF2DD3A|nr:hypothetical protein [Jannaschia sp. S6380]MCK0168194.1 hypothetical protein [Jannaschia sp. S6380]